MSVAARVGFMQGRLSDPVDGRIQAFPWESWQQEFAAGAAHGFHMMEWTLDQERLYENPLLTSGGQAEIRALCGRHDFAIPSLTGDCFMQAPLWKAHGTQRTALERDFDAIAAACAAVGISTIVVPLVDNGRLATEEQERVLLSFLESRISGLAAQGLCIAFECDFAPEDLARFIARLPAAQFGINYDIGNSAALGFDPVAELSAYGSRIVNVHVKDRMLGGTTVPLGAGNARFDAVFGLLSAGGYQGNYILQTARASDGHHAQALRRYRDMTIDWVTHAARARR